MNLYTNNCFVYRDHITATDEDLRLLQQRSTPGVATTTFQVDCLLCISMSVSGFF